MKSRVFLGFAACLLVLAVFLVWMRLPLINSGIWMSPDETATAVAAVNLVQNHSLIFHAAIPPGLEWAHPRSWVFLAGGGGFVPVGFLGMPILLAKAYSVWGLLGINLATPFLALATLFPLWCIIPRRWPRGVRLMTVLVWMAFPTVILYANRGLFAQLPVTCLAIWLWWGITDMGKNVRGPLQWLRLCIAGLALGLALFIRPVEAFWLLPLVVFAGLARRSSGASRSAQSQSQPKSPRTNGLADVRTSGIKPSDILAFGLPCLILLALGACIGYLTYGTWLVSGYQIREISTLAATTTAALKAAARDVSLFSALPFSVHPRNIWWNAWHFLGWFLLPWSLVAAISLALAVRERVWRREGRWGLVALLWASASLILFYGNGLYQDGIHPNDVTLGNSFLRYTLPLSVAYAMAAGWIMRLLWNRWTTRALAACLAAILCTLGLWSALTRDSEGIFANERELAKYGAINQATQAVFRPDSYLVSDRSDKIFFPSYLAVSPMPDNQRLASLIASGRRVGLFLTTQDEGGAAQWASRGFVLHPLFTNGNQTMYDVSLSTGNQ